MYSSLKVEDKNDMFWFWLCAGVFHWQGIMKMNEWSLRWLPDNLKMMTGFQDITVSSHEVVQHIIHVLYRMCID